MELDPDMDELMRLYDDLMQYFKKDEGEELVCFVYLIRRQQTLSYDDVDDFAASIAIAKLQSD